MSLVADKVHELLIGAFPFARIVKEYSIEYKGKRMFVDFFLPSYSIAVEVHGQQHDKFVQHFHVDEAGWRNHRYRDRAKEEWASLNNITLVIIHENEVPKTKEGLIGLIEEVCYG